MSGRHRVFEVVSRDETDVDVDAVIGLASEPEKEVPPLEQATCDDAVARRHLLRYAAHDATEFEERIFERHLMSCDACFEDLVALWRVAAVLSDWPDEPEARSRRSSMPDGRRRPRAVVAMGLLAAAAAALLLLAL
jgi:hypothetical protein